MTYSIKEIFYTLQGEGARTGRPAVFCRFSGCNLWSGREEDRATAVCQYCDTDFLGVTGASGGKFTDAYSLAQAINALWPENFPEDKYVVFTGGEPLLQLDEALINQMHQHGFEVAVETNGTLPVPESVDWVCVSPKVDSELVVKSGDELKLVIPQEGLEISKYEFLAFSHFYLQPLDNAEREANTQLAIKTCLHNPRWKLSLQTHKYLNIP